MLALLAQLHSIHTTGISRTIGNVCENPKAKFPDTFRGETMTHSRCVGVPLLADDAAGLGVCEQPLGQCCPHVHFGNSVFFLKVHFAIISRPQMELGWSGIAESNRFSRKGILS